MWKFEGQYNDPDAQHLLDYVANIGVFVSLSEDMSQLVWFSVNDYSDSLISILKSFSAALWLAGCSEWLPFRRKADKQTESINRKREKEMLGK